MKKGITIISIILIVIFFGLYEVISVRKILTSMEDIINDLYTKYEVTQEDITIYYDEVGNLKEFWEEKENLLCYIFNHRDLSVITDSINRLRAYTKNNDFDNSVSELAMLREYSTKSYHIMGFNIHNIL